tara:strand:- start:1953 stop:3317 length:1365 start_codon:yes stop_codon:yes gene_type:complete
MKYEVYQLSDGTYSIRPISDGVVDGVTIFADAARAMIAANKLNAAQKTDEEDSDIEVETTIVPDEVRIVDGKYYYVYSIDPEEVNLPASEPTVYFYYVSDYLYDPAKGVPQKEGIDDIEDFAVSFGNLEEIDGDLRGNPLELLAADIFNETKRNPFLLLKEEEGAVNNLGEDVGGQYATLYTYLEDLFEQKGYDTKDYDLRSPALMALSAEERAYATALFLGDDVESNASLRALQDTAMFEVSSLMLKYGLTDMDEELVNTLYDMRYKGKLNTKTLSEQFRLAVFTELPGYRDPRIVQAMKDNNIRQASSKAYMKKVDDRINSKLGKTLGSGFTKEDKQFLTNVYGLDGGEAILDAELQSIWDSNVSEKYQGRNYATVMAGLRPVLLREGNFDENGRDVDFVQDLLRSEEDVQKNARKYFLGVGDQGALNKMASTLKGSGLGNVIRGGAATGVY